MDKNPIKSVIALIQILAASSSAVITIVLFLITGLCFLYVLSPVDLIPDVIPIIGWLDDCIAIIASIITGIGAIISGITTIGVVGTMQDDEIEPENNEIEIKNIEE